MFFIRKNNFGEEKSEHNDLQRRLNAIEKNIATIRFTPNGIITYANTLFLSSTGYQLDEIIGQHHKIFCEPQLYNSNDYSNFWQKLASGSSQKGIFKRIKKMAALFGLRLHTAQLQMKTIKLLRSLNFAQMLAKGNLNYFHYTPNQVQLVDQWL